METVVKANADKYTKALKKQVENTRTKVNGLLDDLIKKIDDTSSIEVKTERVAKPKAEPGQVEIRKDSEAESEVTSVENSEVKEYS